MRLEWDERMDQVDKKGARNYRSESANKTSPGHKLSRPTMKWLI